MKRLEDLVGLGMHVFGRVCTGLRDPLATDAMPTELAGEQVALPVSSGGRSILPGQEAEIIARPQASAFRPEALKISNGGTPGGAADWAVVDIKIGRHSQFRQQGDIPGDMFDSPVIDSFVTFEAAQVEANITVRVRYDGPIANGVPFQGSFLGTAFSDHVFMYVEIDDRCFRVETSKDSIRAIQEVDSACLAELPPASKRVVELRRVPVEHTNAVFAIAEDTGLVVLDLGNYAGVGFVTLATTTAGWQPWWLVGRAEDEDVDVAEAR